MIQAGKVTSFEKFYLIRQLSKKPGRAVWRKVTLRPPGLESADASLACCCDNKKPGNPAPLSLDPLFHQLEAGERKSETDTIQKHCLRQTVSIDFFDSFGLIWTLMAYHELFWALLNSFGFIWTHGHIKEVLQINRVGRKEGQGQVYYTCYRSNPREDLTPINMCPTFCFLTAHMLSS